MRLVLLLLLFVFSTSLWARIVTTQIHDIDHGRTTDDETLIFLTSGDVVSIDKLNKSILSDIEVKFRNKSWVIVNFNDRHELIAIEETKAPATSPISFLNRLGLIEQSIPEAPYMPTVLENMDVARSYFYDAQTNSKESQCYNRAHSWTYHWRTTRNLYSSKAWLFFTRRYIRKYKFGWWFHVAPMVKVIVDGQIKDRVMDIKYARGPINLKTWTNIFIRDNKDCPVVQKYSDQANFPESGPCFLMKSSMYYYQPVDLDQLEQTGIEKTRWVETEVRQALLEAFDITL